jgi:NADH-quinone oxidoreductase subunit J
MSIGDVLLYFFAAGAVLGGLLMLVARHPMRVALALIASMLSLAGVYAMLGVHAVAVFQVLIYVGAVMVFMVFVIMLLDVRDASFVRRYGHMLAPGIVAGSLLLVVLAMIAMPGDAPPPPAAGASSDAFLVQPFSLAFLEDYWLHFELTSVLLLAAVIGAISVIKGRGRDDG